MEPNSLIIMIVGGYIQILILRADVSIKLKLCRPYSTDTTALKLPDGY